MSLSHWYLWSDVALNCINSGSLHPYLLAPIICVGVVLVPCFCIQCFVSFLLCNYLDGEERSGCFTLNAFLMSCESQCSVTLPHGAMCWSAVCERGIF